MARTKKEPLAPADMPAILPAKEASIVDAQNSALTPGEADEVLAAGIDLGRLEAMDFVATVANSAILSIYENVKKSKAWRLLRNPQSGDGRHFESLDEFCEIKLGKSYKRMRELALNRNVLGQEAFEQAERLGLHQRDYNAIKALPAPDQELVRRAVEEAKSRDEVIDLMQELAVRSAQEREGFAKHIENAKKDGAAVEKRLSVVTKQKEDAEARAARIAVATPNEALAELRQESVAVMNDGLGVIRGMFRNALSALEDQGPDNAVFMAGLVGQLQADLQALREEFNLPDTSTAALAQLAAETAQWADA